MDKVEIIEKELGLALPVDFREFLIRCKSFVLDKKDYCRILQDNYRTHGIIYELYTVDNFLERQLYRDLLFEMQTHFENPSEYVESKFLYYIADGTGTICISLGGKHYGKIYSVDNGDFGIIYQAENINSFVDSLYDPLKYSCTGGELKEAVKNDNLPLLRELIETKDGDKQIEHSTPLDVDLFELAYRNNFDNILQYLISKGYKGYNRAEKYQVKF